MNQAILNELTNDIAHLKKDLKELDRSLAQPTPSLATMGTMYTGALQLTPKRVPGLLKKAWRTTARLARRSISVSSSIITDSTFWFCVAVISGWLFFEGYTHHAKETARCEERGKLLSDVPWKYDGSSCVMMAPIKRDIPVSRMVRGAA